MAPEEDIPGDIISLGDDSDEEQRSGDKRSLADLNSSDVENDQPSHISKRTKLGHSSISSNTSKMSEEGEIDDKAPNPRQSPSTNNAATQSFVPSDPPLFTTETVSLKLPALSQKKEGSWVDRVSDWTSVLCSTNFDCASSITPATIVSAFAHYTDVFSGLKPPKKRTAKQTVRAMEESGKISALIAAAKPPAQSKRVDIPEDGEIADSPEYEPREAAEDEEHPTHNENRLGGSDMSNGSAAPVAPEPTAAQQRYFPSAENPADMCTTCGRQGHNANSCDRDQCIFCKESGHWSFTCRSISSRCSKCRQLGHEASSCIEKLALTKDEGLVCAYCGLGRHLETDCTEPWRSFHSDAETVLSVVFLHASCAVCGSRNHFASDCAQRGTRPYNPSWTLHNRDLFLDPKCSKESIEESGGSQRHDGGRNGRRENAIRGHASRMVNVHYSESDDSDMDLLSSRTASRSQRAPLGRIQMSTNLQMPKMGNHQVQPPLPPGPPPPLPATSRHPPPPGATNYRGSGGPPPSLPPKPPAARNNNNGVLGQAGRGARHSTTTRGRGGSKQRGRGGRGNGRGRGRR